MDIWDDFLEMEPSASKYVRPTVESFTFGWRLDFTIGMRSMFISVDASGESVIGAYYVCAGTQRITSGRGDIADMDFIHEMARILDEYFIKEKTTSSSTVITSS